MWMQLLWKTDLATKKTKKNLFSQKKKKELYERPDSTHIFYTYKVHKRLVYVDKIEKEFICDSLCDII